MNELTIILQSVSMACGCLFPISFSKLFLFKVQQLTHSCHIITSSLTRRRLYCTVNET